MKDKTKAAVYKNLICVSIGLLLLFLTSIFVIKGIYQAQIDSLINQTTILKDAKYPTWGQFPGTVDASYTHTATLYNLTIDGEAVPLKPAVFNYSYKYANMSFGQGDQGTIQYLNQWKRQWSKDQEDLKKMNVESLNLGLQKVYNYQYYSPQSRRFVLSFNYLWSSMKQYLPTFYGKYIHLYYLHDQDVVSQNIFNTMHIPAPSQQLILNHDTYGWNNPQNLGRWVTLAHLKQERTSHPNFQLIRQACQLSEQQLQSLVGQQSIIYKLSAALNGTIKNKVENTMLQYQTCIPFCNDDQLISIQLVTGYITNTPLMGKLTLNSLFNQLNTSYPFPVQYGTFCQNNPQYTCIGNKNAIDTFNKLYLNNFTIMSKVLANRDNYDLVETLFEVENTMKDGSYGQSLIAYIDYLNSRVFNSYNAETELTDRDSYKYMLPNHQYLLKNINYLSTLLQQELLVQGINNHILSSNLTCQQFFTGAFSSFSELCNLPETDLTDVQVLRWYISTYFFKERQHFSNITTMDSATVSNFLRFNKKDSLLASLLQKTQKAISISAQCKNVVCSSTELLAKEWGGSLPLLSKLPVAYFPSGSVDLFELDYLGAFNKVDPRYWKLIGQTLPEKTASQLVSDGGQQSIMVLLNLMKYKSSSETLSKKIIRYVQKSVVDTYFGGYITTSTVEDAINGKKIQQGIQIKRRADPMQGGAPWLSSSAPMFQTVHKPTTLNKLNTGIYEKDKLRAIYEVDQQTKASSQYTVFSYDYEDVEEILLTEKSIFGTNLLGFRQEVSASDSLTVYLDFISYGATLKNIDSQFTFNGNLSTFKYSIQGSGEKIPVGVQEQNERYIIIDPSSYIVVEPVTGLTLQASIKYTTFTAFSSLPLYRQTSTATDFRLFDMEVGYKRRDLSKLDEIFNNKQEMYMLNVIIIGLASVSMVMIFLFSVLYYRKRKVRRSDAIESLMEGQSTTTVI